jgi:hypothetical protein
MNWIDSIVVGILTTIILVLAYRLIKLRMFFKQLSELYLQAMADKALLERKITELYQEIENVKLKETDGFLKFVSDSRDWAFQYIEEVQKALAEFDKEVAPEFEWTKTFGMVLGETTHTIVLKRISEAYDKLKLVLPENTETPNN